MAIVVTNNRNIGLVVEGIPGAKRLVKRRQKENPAKLKKGLVKAATFLKKRSQELCPVDTGALRASAKVVVKGNLRNLSVSVTYGDDDDINYAVFVHENMDVFHPIGQAKFLEQPAREYRRTLIHFVEEQFA